MPDTLITGFYSAADTPLEIYRYDQIYHNTDTDPRTCTYVHFDLSETQLGPTNQYNCWGFTFLPRRYWFSRAAVDTLIQDNCDAVPDGSVEEGDIIRYQDNGQTTHTGRVWQTDGAGHATLIRSKWGPSSEKKHAVSDVPLIYGTEIAFFRQKKLIRGDITQSNIIGDLWIKDSPTDTGGQGLRVPWWTSPDILVDVPPYDGIPDLNPVFSHPNRIWAVVKNRTNQRIDNVLVRFYWADPAAGLPPSSWNLIPGSPAHPNPVGPISINADSEVSTDYVEWTPSASPAHQCLLAIAYINDDPRDSNNPDPITYPFEIPWDNNISQRNVHIIELGNGSNGGFAIQIGNPYPGREKRTGSITAILTYSPQLPFMGIPASIKPLKVSLSLNDTRPIALQSPDSIPEYERHFIKDNLCHRQRAVAAVTLEKMTLSRKKPHRLTALITVPKDVPKGSIYYLHIVQRVSNIVTGGYTGIIITV